jgi:beta-lactamase superfamily II metal-dependent hydrolase
MILTGDATPEALARIARTEGVAADAVLLPHHGEESPELIDLLAATGARVGVMSVGWFRDQHRRRTITWPRDLRVFRTWQEGAVSVLLSEDGVRVETFLEEDSR